MVCLQASWININMGERKLVQAFRTFFERTVSPHLSQNEQVNRQWNHLNKILSSDPIDYTQIEFYLLLSNKNNSKGSQQNIGSYGKITEDPSSRFRQSDFNLMRPDRNANIDKKGSLLGSGTKKRNLITNLQSFQKLLTQNQQKLQGMSRNGNSQGNNTNGMPPRRY